MDVIKKISQNKGMKGICAFLESSFFPILVGAIVLVCYVLHLSAAALIILGLLAAFICLFCEDTLACLPIVILIEFSLRYKGGAAKEIYLTPTAIKMYIACAPILVFALLYRLCARRVKWENKSGLLAMALLSVAFLLGGLLTEYYSLKTFVYAIRVCVCLFVCYVFFAFTLKKRENLLVYLARIFVISIFVIALQVAEHYFRYYQLGTPLDSSWKGAILFGWAGVNTVGEMMAMMIPAVFYLIYKERWGYFYWLVLPVACVAIFLTLCRNALLWAAFFVLVGMAINCFAGEKKEFNQFLVVLLGIAAFAVFIRLYTTQRLEGLFEFFEGVKLDDRGRFDIWQDFYKMFLQSPLNGVGFKNYLGKPSNYTNVNYAHNFIFQMLGSTGLLGMFLSLAHLLLVGRIVVKNSSKGRWFIVGCILAMLGISMLSPFFFLFCCQLYYSITILCLEKSNE